MDPRIYIPRYKSENINVLSGPRARTDVMHISNIFCATYWSFKYDDTVLTLMGDGDLYALPELVDMIATNCAINPACIPQRIKKNDDVEDVFFTAEEMQCDYIKKYFSALNRYKQKIPEICSYYFEKNEDKCLAERSWIYNAMKAPTGFKPFNQESLWPYATKWMIENPQIWRDKSLFNENEVTFAGKTLLEKICEMEDKEGNHFYAEEKILLCRYRDKQKCKLLLVEFQDDGKVKTAICTDAKTQPNHRIVTDMANGFEDDRNPDAQDIVEHAMPLIKRSGEQIRNIFN